MGENRNTPVIATKEQADILDFVQMKLRKSTFPRSPIFRKFGYALLLLWVLFTDFMVMYYGLQFDRDRTYDTNPETEAKRAAAVETCPSHPALDWLTDLELQAQHMAVENSYAADEVKRRDSILYSVNVAGESDSSKWLAAVFCSILMAWFINSPLIIFATTLVLDIVFFGGKWEKHKL